MRKITLQVDLVIPDDDETEEWRSEVEGILEEECDQVTDVRVMWS